MTREFIILPEFDKLWSQSGFSDDDLRILQEYLCLNPDSGKLIPGTGGLRKLRWALSGQGKRGSVRTLYIDFVSFEKIYLVSIYRKNVQISLTNEQKGKIKKLTKQLKAELYTKKLN